MATDYRNNIAGDYPQGFPLELTCILDEGAITVGEAYDRANTSEATYAFAAELKEGDWVALSNDTANTWVATGGLPVVERAQNTEALVIGRIRSAPKPLRELPASSGVADTWAKRIAAKYYRIAKVELHAGITKVMKADVKSDGSNGVAIGVATTLNLNIATTYASTNYTRKPCFITAAANGTGVIPMHYMDAGSSGDQANILIGITGPMYAVTGS